MRRRPDSEAPPAELLTFHGRRYVTAAEWEAAFAAFHAARAEWLAGHGVSEFDAPGYTVDGDCPFDKTAL
ncbi:MAG: hypothetical protein ACLP4W_08780 [Mycobacterium sp.]|uniref:hypothetical protein n=1 Tax=Mycobacterium sp. TaxID=1785 RepID=UPI003F9E900D